MFATLDFRSENPRTQTRTFHIQDRYLQYGKTERCGKNTDNGMSNTNPDFEMWVQNENAQYRIQNQKLSDNIRLTFWIPNEPNKHFNTTYENLIKIIENSANKDLYTIIP